MDPIIEAIESLKLHENGITLAGDPREALGASMIFLHSAQSRCPL